MQLHLIPKGATSLFQPLDVFGFYFWKNYIRRFSDIVILTKSETDLHSRDSILKLQSLVHNQLSSPRYVNTWKYGWFKSGYLQTCPENFDNPVEFAFDEGKTKCDICGGIAVVRCSWCKKNLCFKHFYEEYHYCDEYIQQHQIQKAILRSNNTLLCVDSCSRTEGKIINTLITLNTVRSKGTLALLKFIKPTISHQKPFIPQNVAKRLVKLSIFDVLYVCQISSKSVRDICENKIP